jgi:carbamoylphosphate synthase large subunit/ADP-ribose pyrophosphatase YjhB (NUDIX family)
MSPKNQEIKKVLIIGSGPIVIGQAAEFDYSGTQACMAMRENRVETVLVNSNPATIQTDPDIADKVYIEPLNPTILEKIIIKEKPDGVLATVGGQTGLNIGSKLKELGILEKYGVKFLGTDYDSIKKGEDRGDFKDLMIEIGQPVLPSKSVSSVEEGLEFAKSIGFPVILRVAYTLGGTGGNTAFDEEDLKEKLGFAIKASPVGQTLLEKSILGWMEYEYEMIRDGDGNKLVVCNMENIDPMGVHTGESTVVAPSQTLSDSDHQVLRSSALEIVESLNIRGGCNVQFALNTETGEYYVIEVNPRLSRSSALASKATGYPIAKVATKIALGLTLPEIVNDITEKTAFFEPALDYVVIKIPRWPDDKFPEMDNRLGITMKSTGEVMAIGRNFEEALYKAIESLDIKYDILEANEVDLARDIEDIKKDIKIANSKRLKNIFLGFRKGLSVDEIVELSQIHPWFIHKIEKLFEITNSKNTSYSPLTPEVNTESPLTPLIKGGIGGQVVKSVYKMVDTCAGEFEAKTPYFYSTFGSENEATETLYYQHEANFDYLIDKAKKDGRDLVLDAMIFNKDGRVFVQKRRPERKFLPNCWGVVGGHYEDDNSIRAGIDRIIFEETGWRLGRIRSLIEIRDWEFEGIKKRTLVFDVEALGDLEVPRLETDKVTGFLWISKNELPLFYENKNYGERLMYKVCKKGLEMHNEPKKVIILGSGPIRIGQGVEFDYLTVHAVRALQKKGIKAIIINNNPETVSTDYSTSDRLYFEPLTPKYVNQVIENEKEGLLGVIAQFGGQTAINLAEPLEKEGVKVLGTTASSIDLAEDREKTGEIVKKLGYKMPEWGIAFAKKEVLKKAQKIGYPVLLRPSFVLGGEGMKVVYSDEEVEEYLDTHVSSEKFEKPLLIDKFIEGAVEVDVDFISDGKKTYCFILEQLDKAGVHSGDSACVFPAQNLERKVQDKLVEITRKISKAFKVIGIGNLQCAVKDGEIYVIEVNPRASRTVPFVSKCLGFSLTEMATNVIMGSKLPEFDFDLEYYKTPEYAWSLKEEVVYKEQPVQKIKPKFVAIKWPVFCLEKLIGVNQDLGPLMKSTGEAMTVGKTFEEAKRKWLDGENVQDVEVVSL